jgi:RPA family protein
MEPTEFADQRTSVTFQKRQTAVKINIATLRRGTFIQMSDLQPNFVDTDYGHVNRVNIIGILVSKDETNTSCIIDDKTSIILVQNQFSSNQAISLEDIDIGTPVNVIGRPRVFNDDMYIVPEIIIPLKDALWLKVREREIHIQNNEKFKVEFDEDETVKQINTSISSDKKQKAIEEEDVKEEIHDSFEIVQEFIKKNDSGDGVQTNDLLSELQGKNVHEPESMVKKLLEHGEIFEIMPGKLKLLQ